MVRSSLSFLIMATASSKETVPRLSPLRLRMVTVRFSASRSPRENYNGFLIVFFCVYFRRNSALLFMGDVL